MSKYGEHKSILVDECKRLLFNPKRKQALHYLDITLGGGGHIRSFIESEDIGKVTALDQDKEAIAANQDLLNLTHPNVKIIHTNFHDYLLDQGSAIKETYDVILGDLGVSSHHFDSPDRGFSFRFDAELDMRMNTDSPVKALDIINAYTEEELLELLEIFGEEKFARRIVSRIVEERRKKKITRTKELEEICFLSYPKTLRHKRTHPATKTFQALRIEVNRELEVLEKSLPLLFHALKPGGKLGIISFHSIEDRIVKRSFKEIYSGNKSGVDILTKKPVGASEIEIQKNPRSRSAKLRVIEKKVL